MIEPVISDEQPDHTQAVHANRRSRMILLIGICCVGFFAADVATPVCFEEPVPAMLILGIVTAQLTVICVWGTLVRGTFWIRLPWTLLLLVLSWCGFAWGIALERGGADTDSMLGAAGLWMFGFVVSFVPLKIAAMCFQWQIVQASGDGRRKSGYAIRDIMIGTLLLALSMGIGRAMLLGEDVTFSRALRSSGLTEAEPLFALSVYGVVSLLVKLPCIWISLGEKAEKIQGRIVAWVVYCFVLAIVEFGVLTVVLGDPGPEGLEILAGMILSHQLMGAIMLGVCLGLRALGYRLERSLREPVAHVAAESDDIATSPEAIQS